MAIAHYNRGQLAHRPLCNLLNNDFVAEIILFDDGSRPEEFAALKGFVARLNCGERIRVLRREKNCGAQTTKLDAVEACEREWVLLLDSDNTVFPGFLKGLSRISSRNPRTFYCSPFAFPYFSFHPFAGKQLDFEHCVSLTRSGELRRIFIINDGNYLVHRETYLSRIGCLRDLKSDVADVMMANYLWLSGRGTLSVLPKGAYHHRIDPSSFWMNTADESRQRVVELFARFEQDLRWDDDFAVQVLKG